MKSGWIEIWNERDEVPDSSAGAALERLCGRIEYLFSGERWHSVGMDAMAAEIARSLGEALEMPDPLALHLKELMQKLDVGLAIHDRNDQSVTFDLCPATGQWQIHLPDGLGRRHAMRALEGLFLVLFWRLRYRLSWWNVWRARNNIENPRRMASCFALNVALPPESLRDLATCYGLNLWQLADLFGVTPGACLYALRRHVRFSFPYFLARLDFDVQLDQQRLFFASHSLRARVKTKFLAAPDGGGRPHDLDALKGFPRQESVVEAQGPLRDAICGQRALIWSARDLLDVRLPQEVCFAALPGASGEELLVQCVPSQHRALLMRGVWEP